MLECQTESVVHRYTKARRIFDFSHLEVRGGDRGKTER
jgi:hypothetical protein